MKKIVSRTFAISLIILFSLAQTSCSQNEKNEAKNYELAEESPMLKADVIDFVEKTKNFNIDENLQSQQNVKKEKYKVTFVELGSVRCIPCQKMQPIMKSIEEKYPNQVKVVFHDVWTEEGKSYGDKYNIKLIPTQVFLDENGVEYFRHEGFFPEEELVKVLQAKGVK